MSIEDRYLSGLVAVQYPDVAVDPGTAEPSLDGMQLAAGPSQTVSDAGGGVRVGRAGVPYKSPSMRDITEPVGALLDMGAATVKGATQGFIGLPGDLENIGRIVLNAMGVQAGEKTVLPTTDEVKSWLDTNVGQVGNGKNPYESMGEVVAPGGQVKALKAAGRGAKALAPKAGEMVLDSMNKLGSPVQMNMMPDAPAMAPKPTAPTSDIGFYSAVEQAALNIKRNAGNGQAMLNDLMKGENVKADEIKWIGLDDFLKGKKNVTKQEVQDYIAQNKVDVQEVQLGEQGAMEARQMAVSDITETLQAGGMFDDDAQWALKTWQESAPGSRLESQARVLLEEKLIYAGENRTVSDFLDAGAAQTDSTKFASYTLPGGENYREILLTLPAKRLSEDEARKVLGAKPDAKLSDADISYASRKAVDEYRSSHWEQPNVLAHLRVNDRVDADGKKMLLVEEVQSDWHQAGRDKGYAGADKVKGYQVSVNGRPLITYETKAEAEAHIARANALDPEQSVSMAEVEASPQLINEFAKGKVPDAPMKDTWYQLALKRALKYAADNGYERVGLTTGARQAERYDLSKQVEEIRWSKHPDGTYGVNAISDGDSVISQNKLSIEQVAELVGKDIAKKIESNSAENFAGSLKGVDLSVGGEGMKQYYDQTYPQFLAKYGKKWGAKMGETYVPIYDKATQKSGAEPIRYIEITPDMRESVGKGQPLFSATAAGGAGAGATMQDKENK